VNPAPPRHTATTGPSAPRPLTLAVDLDGVCYPLVDTLRHWLTTRRGIPASRLPDPATYDLATAWGFTDDAALLAEIAAACHAGALFHHEPADPAALHATRSIRAAGHRIIAITARNLPGIPPDIEQITRDWAASAGLPVDDVIITGDKHLIPFDLLVDDSPSNVHTALAHGRRAVLLDQPWNRDAADLPRTDWPQIPDLLTSLAQPAQAA
jgi:5'(3')-deoxyribonucleotidase